MSRKILPQALDAERAVLGGIITGNSQVADEVLEIIPGEVSFYLERHQVIFQAIRQLHRQNIQIDMLSLADQLVQMKKIDNAGGRSYIDEISEQSISLSNVLHYSKIVREKATLRALIRFSQNLMTESFQEQNIEEIINKSSGEFQKICESQFKGGFVPISDIVHESFQEVEDIHTREDYSTGTKTGVKELDEMTTGFGPSDMIVLAGATSSGKTAFALNISLNIALEKRVVGVFSIEMSAKQLVQRLMAMTARVDSHKMRTGYLSKEERKKLFDIVPTLAGTRIYIDDDASQTIDSMRIQARLLQRTEGKIDLLVVDYLQLVRAVKREQTREREIAEISHGLKQIARELECPVLALSQLSRNVEKRHGEPRPRLSDLRESGAIEQDADAVVFIYRPEQYGIKQVDIEGKSYASNGITEIIIAKQRKGPVGAFHMMFEKHTTSFNELELSYSDENEFADEEPWEGEDKW